MTVAAPHAEQRTVAQVSERLEIAVRALQLAGVDVDPEIVVRACELEHHAHPKVIRRLIANLAASP